MEFYSYNQRHNVSLIGDGVVALKDLQAAMDLPPAYAFPITVAERPKAVFTPTLLLPNILISSEFDPTAMPDPDEIEMNIGDEQIVGLPIFLGRLASIAQNYNGADRHVSEESLLVPQLIVAPQTISQRIKQRLHGPTVGARFIKASTIHEPKSSELGLKPKPKD
jgi:hypothetical protein